MRKLFIFLLFFPICLSAQTYWVDTLFSGLLSPVAFDFTPDGRIFVTQKGGSIAAAYEAKIKVYTSLGNFIGDFYDLTDSVDADFERGLLGIAIDPDYLNNQFVYAYYVHRYPTDEHIRIVRFTDVNNAGTNPTIIFDIDVPDNLPGTHFGGNLHFRPSEPNIIYFTIGDLGSNQTDTSLNYAHMLNNAYGKTLRIAKDGSIPPDNPFYDDGNIYTGNCDIIWSYEHRNPFDFCFSPVNDSFYVSENGLTSWDEVNIIHRGASYGWNACEGNYMNSSTTVLCNDTNSVLPIATWGAPLGGLTGILFYSGSVMSEFNDHLLVADIDYGNIYDLTLGNAPAYDTVLSKSLWMDATTSGGITTLKQGPEGCVYAMNGGYTNNGSVIRICPSWMGVSAFSNDPVLLQQNFPNPFTESTTLHYHLTRSAEIQMILYDTFGKKVAVLEDCKQESGDHSLVLDNRKLRLSEGTYHCVLYTSDFTCSIDLLLIGK